MGDDDRQIMRDIFRDKMSRHSISIVVGLVFFAFYSLTKPYKHFITKSRFVQFLGLFMSPYLITSMVSDPLNSFFRDLIQMTQFLFSTYVCRFHGAEQQENTVTSKYHRLSFKIRKFVGDTGVPTERREYLQRMLRNLYRCLQQLQCSGVTSNAQIDSAITGIQCVVSLPVRRRVIENTPELHQNVDQIIAHYSPNLQQTIRSLTFRTVQRSIGRPCERQILYLTGEPGTGKTTFVRQYAAILKLPIIHVSLADTKAVDDLTGNHYNYNQHVDLPHVSKHPGKIAQAIINDADGCTNAILFFDECHLSMTPSITQFLLGLCDPMTKKILFGDLGYYHSIEDYIFIFAGNSKFKNHALNDRMLLVDFPPVDIGLRVKIAGEHMRKKFERPEDYTTEIKTRVADIVFADKNPGVRTMLRVLDEYYYHLWAVREKWIEGDFEYANLLAAPESALKDTPTERKDDLLC